MTGTKAQVQDICIIGLGQGREEESAGLQEGSRVMASLAEAGAACLLLDPERYEEIPEEVPFLILCVPGMAGGGEQAAAAAADHFRRQWLRGKKDRRKAGIAVWIRTSMGRDQLPPSLAVYRSFHDGSQMADWVLEAPGKTGRTFSGSWGPATGSAAVMNWIRCWRTTAVSGSTRAGACGAAGPGPSGL